MITTSADWSEVKFNGTDIAQVNFNGVKVWEKPAAGQIYGVSWLKSKGTQTRPASCVMSRTDAASSFSDPVAYMDAEGYRTGSSPFDDVMPWSGMVKETVGDDIMVKIPKFWFKVEETSTLITVKIANYAADGFEVSPIHRERGEGWPARDYVYVGRYMLNSACKSISSPTTNLTLEKDTLTNICSHIKGFRGTGYYPWDLSVFTTLQLLYLVEYANWDFQSTVGNNSVSNRKTGLTDSMPYHTGTMSTIRAGGAACQYRNIEFGGYSSSVGICNLICQGTTIYTWDDPNANYNAYASGTGAISLGTRGNVQPNYNFGVANPGARFVNNKFYGFIGSQLVSASGTGCGTLFYYNYPSQNNGMKFYSGIGNIDASTSNTDSGYYARLVYVPQS